MALHGQAKFDSLMATFALLAVLLLVTGRRWGVLPVAWLSVLVKVLTLPLLAAYVLSEAFARQWRRLAVGSALVAVVTLLAYAPFTGGAGLLVSHLGLAERGGASLPGIGRLVVAAAVAGLVLWVGVTSRGDAEKLLQGWALISLGTVLLTPIGWAWYLITPLAVVSLSGERLRTAAVVAVALAFTADLWTRSSGRLFLPADPSISRSVAYLGAVLAMALLASSSCCTGGAAPPADPAGAEPPGHTAVTMRPGAAAGRSARRAPSRALEHDDRHRRVGVPAGREDAGAGDVEVGHAVHPAVGVHDAVGGRGAHPGGAQVVRMAVEPAAQRLTQRIDHLLRARQQNGTRARRWRAMLRCSCSTVAKSSSDRCTETRRRGIPSASRLSPRVTRLSRWGRCSAWNIRCWIRAAGCGSTIGAGWRLRRRAAWCAACAQNAGFPVDRTRRCSRISSARPRRSGAAARGPFRTALRTRRATAIPDDSGSRCAAGVLLDAPAKKATALPTRAERCMRCPAATGVG